MPHASSVGRPGGPGRSGLGFTSTSEGLRPPSPLPLGSRGPFTSTSERRSRDLPVRDLASRISLAREASVDLSLDVVSSDLEMLRSIDTT